METEGKREGEGREKERERDSEREGIDRSFKYSSSLIFLWVLLGIIFMRILLTFLS